MLDASLHPHSNMEGGSSYWGVLTVYKSLNVQMYLLCVYTGLLWHSAKWSSMPGFILAVGLKYVSLEGSPWLSLCPGWNVGPRTVWHKFHLLENWWGACSGQGCASCLLGRCVLSLGAHESQWFSDTTSILVRGEAVRPYRYYSMRFKDQFGVGGFICSEAWVSLFEFLCTWGYLEMAALK